VAKGCRGQEEKARERRGATLKASSARPPRIRGVWRSRGQRHGYRPPSDLRLGIIADRRCAFDSTRPSSDWRSDWASSQSIGTGRRNEEVGGKLLVPPVGPFEAEPAKSRG
jgi:hypothetical protein